MNIGTDYSEVNVGALAASEGSVFISFRNCKFGDDKKEDIDFILSEKQVRWLRIALKQANALAFK